MMEQCSAYVDSVCLLGTLALGTNLNLPHENSTQLF
jgi:hypothetical protein